MDEIKWLEIAVNTTPDQLDQVCAKLAAAGMDSLVIEDEQDFLSFLEQNRQYWDYVDQELLDRMKGVTRVKFYVTDDADGRAQLEQYTRGLDQEFTATPLTDNDWAYSWQKYYKPLEIGTRLYVVPQWMREEPVPAGRTPFYLNPGLTFGTGSHPTTQLCLELLEGTLRPGDRVLDVCAAPGGKSFAAAMVMEDRGEIAACDIHRHKLALIEKGAERLGLTCIHAGLADGRQCREEWLEAFDAVLCDVPCSGLGIIRKKPDIRYKDPEPLAGLPQVQRAILDNAARYVKPGGALVYSTCTLLRRENEEVALGFLAGHPDFKAEGFPLPEYVGDGRRGLLTLWPHRQGTDGFFICKLRKEG